MSTGTPVHSLEPTFRRWHATIRRLNVLTGAGWCVGAAIALLLLIGLADWRFHFDSVPLRTAIVLCATAGWGLLLLLRVMLPAVRRMRAVDTARQVERFRPHWRGALISSVEFADAGCRPTEGAPALQQAVIAQASARLTDEDLQPLLRRREFRQATVFAGLMMLIAAAVAMAQPAGAGLALSRMLTPATAADWPRTHVLILLDAAFQPIDPLKPAAPRPLGERLTIYVDDPAAGLPDGTLLQTAAADGAVHSQSVERTTITDKSGRRREIGVASLRSDSSRLRVRAVGGDDRHMAWHTFEFAPRPAVTRYRLALSPPQYTQQPAQEIVATGGDIAALVGTQVRLEVDLDRPVREALFRHSGLAATKQELTDHGRQFAVEFPVPSTAGGTYAIELVGQDGLRAANPQRFRVEGIVDREPSVVLTQPASDLTITPHAVLPVRIEARDDLGLVYVRLSSAEPPGSAGEQLQPLPLATPLAREASIDTQVSAAALGLEPGRTLVIRAEAADAFNLDGRHVVRSVARKLTVVAPEVKQRELIARQAGIAELLERSSEAQSRALQQTRALQMQWRASAQLSANDFDGLRRLAHDQAQLAAALHDPDRGGGALAREILRELAWNGLRDAGTEERLSRLETGLARLQTEVEPALEQGVAETLRQVPDAAAAPAVLTDSLAEVERAQTQANDVLIELAAQFVDWQRHHDLTRTLAEIVVEQSQINRDTRELGRRTLTVPLPDLSSQDRAALASLGQRQDQAAAALERFEQRLRRAEAADDAPGQESTPEPDVQQALELLTGSDLVHEMQRAAQLVARNAIAESAEVQQGLEQSLQQLEETIRGLAAPTPESLIRRVERAEAEAQTLHDRQSQLQNLARNVADSPSGSAALDDIRAQQQQLAEDTADWAQRLRRQRLPDVSANAAEAAANMALAAGELVPDELVAALDHQAAAAEELRQTQRMLRAARQALELDQSMSEWARVAALIDGFAARQSQLVEESGRLSADQARRSALSRSQLRTLLALAGTQGQLADDVADLQESSGSSPIIREALSPVVVQMQTAAAGMAERRLDEVTRQAQQSALDQLRALSRDCQLSSSSSSGDEAAEPGDDQPRPSTWPLTLQLKVLTRLQSEVASRAAAVRTSVADGQSPDDAQLHELQQLADQQSRLAELLGQLLGPEPAQDEE